jgi:hypothetical protein
VLGVKEWYVESFGLGGGRPTLRWRCLVKCYKNSLWEERVPYLWLNVHELEAWHSCVHWLRIRLQHGLVHGLLQHLRLGVGVWLLLLRKRVRRLQEGLGVLQRRLLPRNNPVEYIRPDPRRHSLPRLQNLRKMSQKDTAGSARRAPGQERRRG